MPPKQTTRAKSDAQTLITLIAMCRVQPARSARNGLAGTNPQGVNVTKRQLSASTILIALCTAQIRAIKRSTFQLKLANVERPEKSRPILHWTENGNATDLRASSTS